MTSELHVYTSAATLLRPADLTGDSETVNWDLALLRDFTTLKAAPAADT